MNIQSVPKLTANLYCISLSIDLRVTQADAVHICDKFCDTQYCQYITFSGLFIRPAVIAASAVTPTEKRIFLNPLVHGRFYRPKTKVFLSVSKSRFFVFFFFIAASVTKSWQK